MCSSTLAEINQVLAPDGQVLDFQNVEKSLLEVVFQKAFSVTLNRNCQNCYIDAYWQLRTLRKTLLNMSNLKKHNILKPFETSLQGTAITDQNLTDEQAEKLLKIPYMAQYIETKSEPQKVRKDDNKGH